MRALLLVNPRSGTGRGPALARAVAAGLTRRGVDAGIVVTAAAGEVASLAGEAVGVYDVVVAVGGDGTLNEAARGLLAVHGERLSAGHDAAFMHAFASTRQRGPRPGQLRLALLGLRTVSRYAYPPLTIEVEGGRTLTGTNAIVANVGEIPFAGTVAERDDGRLDVLAIGDPRRLRWLPLVLGVLAGRLSSCRGVEVATATRVRLRAEQPVPAQMDGEAAGWLPLDIEVRPAALRLLVP